ncbi:MAG: DUF2075 domain-containing protein [Candidatus Nitrosopelagicus sp.]|jgi:DUF2075 family protein|nr:DUF2075 domain-containing protein [Candidatus Nitrosopelagicus sp.]
MGRAYYSKELAEFLTDDNDRILGELTNNHQFALEEQQRNAWTQQIEILKNELHSLDSAHIMFEYSIPRMGKRVDVILIYAGIVFVIEFKVHAKEYLRPDIDQCLDYSLDLKNFQEGSHNVQLVPILVSTEASNFNNTLEKFRDSVFTPLRANKNNLGDIIKDVSENFKAEPIDAIKWENSLYKPTPTIIEAAQALYQGHDVKEISRSDSGAINLVKTAEAINNIIEKSKTQKEKSICFVTGVPGAGKTLAGLNLANERHQFGDDEEHAVFLSGNGPLVAVLQEALARNNIENSTERITKGDALQKAKSFIQNIHHFRDDAISVDTAPIEKVVVFDEAQRAWNNDKTTSFMKIKKGIADFDMSEPEFLISVMDRHQDWAVIICLIGGGQEINTGEAGLPEWFSAIRTLYPHWNVYVSNQITDIEYTADQDLEKLFSGMKYNPVPDLHLSTSIRSFRSEHVSNFVKSLLDCDKEKAKQLFSELKEKYPIVLTRDFEKAKQWLKDNARGNERYGITASAKAHRLRPYGIYVESDLDAPQWFLNDKDDVRSSYYLEYVATEFHIQGLELDWTCVGWDANFRYDDGEWSYNQFTGTKWNKIRNEDKIKYLKNTYRVLLTRARQGVVIFIPRGDSEDNTRKPEFYDGTYNYLKEIGIKEI